MKTRSLYLAAVIVIAAAITAVGKDEPGLGMAVVPVKGTEVFKVIYKGGNTNKVKLNVYNSASQIVFSETMNGVDGFIRPLNFAGLQFGEYTIELSDASGKKAEKVSYKPAAVAAPNFHIAKLVSDQGKFLVSVANSSAETITVKIFDDANNLVHVYSKEVAGDFAQLFSVKDVPGGLTFEVSDNAGNYKTIRF